MTTETISPPSSWKSRLDRTEELLLTERHASALPSQDAQHLFQAGVKSLQVCQKELSAAHERLAELIDLAQRRSRDAAFRRACEKAKADESADSSMTISLDMQTVPCPLCGKTDLEDLGRGDRYGMDLRTVRCRGCDFLHTNPRPASASLNAFYQGPYRGLYRHPAKPSLAATLAQGMQERAYHTVNALASARLLPAGSLLDAGCGEGSVLRELRQRHGDCRLQGVELDANYAAFAAGYAGCAVAPSLDDVSGEFEVVTTVHVLEHVLAPVDFLRLLSTRLAPGGKLYVEVPDAGRYRSIQDLHLAHLNHFTAESLLAAGRAAGLHALEIVRHDPPFNPPSLYAVFARDCPAVVALRSIIRQ
jgi:SAM-dependent methyltransferase